MKFFKNSSKKIIFGTILLLTFLSVASFAQDRVVTSIGSEEIRLVTFKPLQVLTAFFHAIGYDIVGRTSFEEVETEALTFTPEQKQFFRDTAATWKDKPENAGNLNFPVMFGVALTTEGELVDMLIVTVKEKPVAGGGGP